MSQPLFSSVTLDDPKGIKCSTMFREVYNGMELNDDRAQLVNERGGEFKAGVRELLARLSAVGKMFNITHQIEQLIALNFQTGCSPSGMSAEDYRKLWPTSVVQPVEYAGRLDLPLLVDTTIPLNRLVVLNHNVVEHINLLSCRDMVNAPCHASGAMCTRYIAWVQTHRWLGRKVADVRKEMAADEVGLVIVEGLHLPGQCESLLRKQGVDIPGSRCGEAYAPCVDWFDDVRPRVCASLVEYANAFYGSASRGTTVVPVTW